MSFATVRYPFEVNFFNTNLNFVNNFYTQQILYWIGPKQGLLELIFVDQIVKRFSNIILLRPGNSGTFATRILVLLVKSHTFGCVFNA